MRLTLRTLLAYMDDILDPADHEDLGKKIEASDFATELIHRSRDTVRRLRLGAPAVMASESDDVLESSPAADANVVSEYLDNTLPPEQVAEFERVCLEPGTTADMHLAEVTSCHHILTMVLGEPAETDPAMRQRMYVLPNKIAGGQKLRIESAHATTTVETSPDATVADVTANVVTVASATSEPERAELPDYLRVASKQRRRTRMIATAIALAVMGGVTMWLVLGALRDPGAPSEVAEVDLEVKIEDSGAAMLPPRDELPVGDDLELPTESPTELAEAPAFVATPPVPEDDPLDFDMPLADVPSDEPVADPSDGPFPRTPGPAPVDEVDEVPVEAREEFIPELPDLGPILGETETPGEDLVDHESPRGDDRDLARSVPPADPSLTLPSELPEGVIETDPSERDEGIEVADVGDDEMADLEEDLRVPDPPGPTRIGNYVGNNDVLLRYDAGSDRWFRLPPRSVILAGDVLLSVPKFRTHVVLGNVNAYLTGGTRIEIPDQQVARDSADAPLEMAVVHGRILLNAGINGSDVRLYLGDDWREFRLGSSASLAIEVSRKFLPGVDPATEVLPLEATWYLTSGTIEWTNDSGETMSRSSQTRWKTVNGMEDAPRDIEQLPNWIDREPMTALDRGAAAILAEELPEGSSISIPLLELNEHRRNEVKALATEASLYVGEFEPFVKDLENSARSRQWDSNIDAVRQALTLGPEMKHKLYDAFETIRGARAAEDLMEMIMGYNAAEIGAAREDIRQGAMVKLIGWLDHDRLDYRVLAFYNLRAITGTGNIEGYNPAGLPRSRSIAVTKIRNRFESNELLPRL